MILESMLQRLYSSLQKGPSLNARPHNSRQRIDLAQLADFQSVSVDAILPSLLGKARKITLPANAPPFAKPDSPQDEWSDEQRKRIKDTDRQHSLLAKLQDIAIDAQDYFNDHGEDALFIGFPIISLPASEASNKRFSKTSRILAPAAFIPITLTVQKGAKRAITIKAAGEGADLIIPNPALLAWLEQQTGEELPEMFEDDTGEDPTREYADILDFVVKSLDLDPESNVGIDVTMEPIRRAEALPDQATILPSAVLGLFPMTNAGLLRDTKRMMEDEDKLEGPIRAFLHREALQLNEGEAPQEVADVSPAVQAASQRPFDQEYFIAPVDPSQARTAQVARSASALVIHGPPGTGKSQTITNIIGDHLARGQRVLFVCDKRTALDVVKYRLDHCGLGHLCGVIHDPSRDRRPLYMGLRDRMDRLVESDPLPNPEDAQNQVNRHLAALDRELKGYFRLLHESAPGNRSFHELAGAWLSFKRLTTGRVQLDSKQLPDIKLELIETRKTDIGEILHRAREAKLSVNPFYGSLAITLDSLLQQSTAELRSRFANIEALASEVDACCFSVVSTESTPPQARDADATPQESTPTAETSADQTAASSANSVGETTSPPEPAETPELLVLQLHPEAPLEDQAVARSALADELERLADQDDPESLLAHYARLNSDKFDQTRREIDAFASERLEILNQDLDREIVLLLSGQLPSIADARRQASDLRAYLETCDGFFSFMQFGKKKAAAEALKPFGLSLTPDSARRALAFLTGVDARWILSDLLVRLRGNSELTLVDDEALRPSISLLLRCNRLVELCEREADAPFSEDREYQPLKSILLEQLAAAPSLAQTRQVAASFRVSSARATHIHNLVTSLSSDKVLTSEAILSFGLRLRANELALPNAVAWSQYVSSIEGLLRLRHGLDQLTDDLKRALEKMALLEFERDDALNELSCIALQNAIRQAIDEHPDLLHIDSARINAAFDEYGQRLQEKQLIARQYIAHHWEHLQRQRLLASTGNRLSSDGAHLRSRLFIRGKRSLKLRQMIAAGESNPQGDPLFDLCPVWMASPSTVAQIFPREPLFDVVVFDEASQCRLEEALPILLRAKRVVIAGDPKQLPPTRFFESGIIESDDSDPETAEELVDQQLSETEDLLSAALNLDVEEAFLDVHYRSQNEALIGFSNQNYYHRRLQPIPGHPTRKALDTPIKLIHVDGVYDDRSNRAEAIAICELIAALLDDPNPPSIGVASFNINQRDLILDLLNDRANDDPLFARRYADARKRRGKDSFEGLFVRNLENVQGDERDHIIISTTFGTDPDGKFRRNFGALSRAGGERRLNVLVTRARSAIHIFTSIPREEYRAESDPDSQSLGRRHLYAYLRYAEQVSAEFDNYQSYLENLKADAHAVCSVQESSYPSQLAAEIGRELRDKQQIGSHVHWGNEGFCVDIALTHPSLPADVTVGILTDFNRYRKTPDPIAWEHFRTEMLRAQGWQIHRVWSPVVAREPEETINLINDLHEEILAKIPIREEREVDEPNQSEVQS